LVLVTSLSWQRSALKVSFNVAQSTLAGALSSIVFLALGGIPMISDPAALAVPTRVTQLVPAAALVLVFMLTNSLSVTGIIALSSNRPVLASWGSAVRQTFAYDVLFSPAAYLVALVYLKVGIFGVVLLTVPLLLVRKFYKTNYELERVNQELLELMVKAIEARDPYTSGHSRRVAQYSRVIGRAIGLSGTELDRVAVAALLHDVGKIHEVYAPILRKPEKLSPAEWSVMQSHPIKSAELVSTVSHLKDVVAPIRHHHENWDGTGYPDGLQGNAIPLAARIILFADTIDAMTTDRPYRKALTEVQVRSELVKFRGKQFDPEMCDKLLASPMFGLLFAPHQRTRTPERTKPVLGSRTEGVIAR
jgi:HD superfamily phosphohydrolase YqeK